MLYEVITAAFYALSLLIMALVAGIITDQLVFPDYQYHAYRVQGELVVQQCCVPLIFGDGVGGPSTYTIPVWHWPFGLLFGAVMILGIAKKLQFFFINPCKGCTWKSYGPNRITSYNVCYTKLLRFLRFLMLAIIQYIRLIKGRKILAILYYYSICCLLLLELLDPDLNGLLFSCCSFSFLAFSFASFLFCSSSSLSITFFVRNNFV